MITNVVKEGLRPLRDFNRRHPSLRYIAVGLATVVFCFFLGERTIFSYLGHMKRKAFLQKEYNYYRPRYEADSARLSEIKDNPELIEHIAREKYYMHAPGRSYLSSLLPPRIRNRSS